MVVTMRVITGTARGARLLTLEGMDTRPTGERVKEAIFSSIQFEIEGRRVLDLFAGSGQLGIEALSRGAQSATFVDSNAQAVTVIKQNLEHVKLADKASVVPGDYAAGLARSNTVFDIAFIDPPYGRGLAEKALMLAAPKMSRQGVILCETAKNDAMPEQAGDFELLKKKNYGKTAVSIYRVKESE
jgi:16S rRNA (guanine(966)-N(2))-methyltransferase RsmD